MPNIPGIPTVCVFETSEDQTKFNTQTNGDMLRLQVSNMSAEMAASMTWLANQDGDVTLEWRVRVKP